LPRRPEEQVEPVDSHLASPRDEGEHVAIHGDVEMPLWPSFGMEAAEPIPSVCELVPKVEEADASARQVPLRYVVLAAVRSTSPPSRAA
jgi:hypothetical protein